MAIKNLRGLIKSTHQQGCTVNKYRLSAEQAKLVKAAELRGGHDEGLRVLLQILFAPRKNV